MSDFKVQLVDIAEILVHPNADRLSIAKFVGMDWQVIVQKDRYKVGDRVIYIPIDSILPIEVETKLFGADSKIKLSKSRVKTIKIRGVISQGMTCDPQSLGVDPAYPTGINIADDLKITKYEPPAPKFQSGMGYAPAANSYKNPNFKEYTKHVNIKNAPNIFGEDEEVVITEKIHGTNFRAGWVPAVANTLWRKLLKLIGLLPKWQFVYGSHRVQISEKMLYKGFYDKNVYAEAVVKYDLKNRIQKGDVIYGEIYGDGIQKDYAYGCKQGEHKLVVFDIMRNGQYLNFEDFYSEVILLNKRIESDNIMDQILDMCPILYKGKFGKADLNSLVEGNSVFVPTQKVREGVVIRSADESPSVYGRKTAKVISPEYLLKDNSDYH